MSDASELVSALVAADSTNPQLVPGGAGEAVAARICADRLAALGAEVEIWEPLPGRPNVVATIRGTGGGGSLMLCGHLDVVAGPPELFRPQVRDGRLYGRGSVDMKGGIAAAILAAQLVAAGERLRGDLIIALVIDEEWLSVGAEALAERYRADAAIFPEQSGLDLVLEHGGFAWFEIDSHGVEAAGSDPAIGRDAIAPLGPVLSEIAVLDRMLAQAPACSYGRGSIHASMIAGGDQLPVYPPLCTLGVERCLIPGETWLGAEREIDAMLELAHRANADARLERRTIVGRDPIKIEADEPIAIALAAAAAAELGRPAVQRGDIGWMDSGILHDTGVPCITFGPVGAGEHTGVEWVDLASVEACTRIYADAARRFLA